MSDARKARLIGACALVLVGFVLLSWLLGSGDHAKKPAAAEAGETVIVLPARPLRTAQVGQEEPVPKADKQAVDAGEKKPEPPVKAKATPTVSQPKPAAPMPSQSPTPELVASPKLGWFVQLGVFGSQANAQSLADKAREGDYRCEIRRLKQGGSTLHRVLVGPYPSEAAADLRVPKLQRWLGETGRVVELDWDG